MTKQVIRVIEERQHFVVTAGGQGVPGRDGDVIGAQAYLQKTTRLSEFDTAQAKFEARENLELENIDGGTFN
jgi:hypothetical protein